MIKALHPSDVLQRTALCLAAVAALAWLLSLGPSRAQATGKHIPAWNTQCAIGSDIAQGCKAVRDRTIVNAARYPWAAIGRINAAGYRNRQHCTGALIGERIVLTAAHCLYDRRGKKWLRPQSIHFLAGYQRGTHVAHATAIGYTVSASHDTRSREHRYDPRQDWALIELGSPIGLQTGYLGWSALTGAGLARALREGGKIALAGYPSLRKEVLSVDLECAEPRAETSGHLMVHRCAAMQGDSGAPILLMENGTATIVAVHSGGLAHAGQVLTVSPGMAAFRQALGALAGETQIEKSNNGPIGRPGKSPAP